MKNRKGKLILFLVSAVFLFISCKKSDETNTKSTNQAFEAPDWSINAVIYEVNTRQYTKEGTFNAFLTHLPKLKEMGIDILWFMPIHPIGGKNRKGSLGSYYSVKNYKEINPEFGTLEDFKNLVKEAHNLGMYVIIDWVANHTAWDNEWTKSHPEFYTRDSTGNFVSPFDWTDVIDLNYDNKELWNYMRDAMKFWVDECNIDGFRCDVAAMVPLDFWKWLRPQLETNKKLFMLAEASEPELHEVFDMTYNWQLKDLFVGIAEGKKNADDLHALFENEKREYPQKAYRMVFTTNHDENSWHGTDKERFGKFAKQFAIITGVVPGMPLVYSGMEGGLDKRLLFFEKDPINWKESEYRSIYTKLFKLKKENKALWNGVNGGEIIKIDLGDSSLFAFVREKENNKILALFNLSTVRKKIILKNKLAFGEYKNLWTDANQLIDENFSLTLEPLTNVIFYK